MLNGTIRNTAQHSVAMLEQCCNNSKQCSNNVATLCFIKLQTVGTTTNLTNSKGDVTRDNSRRRFLAQHSVATTLFRIVTTLFQHCNDV